MKFKSILLIPLILLTSCKDNSYILSSKNIATSKDIENFDSKLINDALVNNGFYNVNAKITWFEEDFKSELFVYETAEFDVEIELDQNHRFIIKQCQGKIENPKRTYKNLNYEYSIQTFYTIDNMTYYKKTSGEYINYLRIPPSVPTIFGLPAQCLYNLEHAINFYTYPIPTTYINDNQIYIKENYPISAYDNERYLKAIYSNHYQKLEELSINTIYPLYELNIQFELSVKSIESFNIEDIPELDIFNNQREYSNSYFYISLYQK